MAGQHDFGENRVQEGLQKIVETAEISIRWHLLGHLQTNKARKAASAFAVVQSVDRVELLQKLDAAGDGIPADSRAADSGGPGPRSHEVRRPSG